MLHQPGIGFHADPGHHGPQPGRGGGPVRVLQGHDVRLGPGGRRKPGRPGGSAGGAQVPGAGQVRHPGLERPAGGPGPVPQGQGVGRQASYHFRAGAATFRLSIRLGI